ncbi:MAG: hypothetical protein R3C61_17345 [Bacteroidia bacterium]
MKIPLELRQSSVAGTVQVLIQGDSSFHPVAMATNSKGDIYITDWQIRHYGAWRGKIVAFREKNKGP